METTEEVITIIDSLSRASIFKMAVIITKADKLNKELLNQIDKLMQAEAGTRDGDELLRLVELVEEYEKVRYIFNDVGGNAGSDFHAS